MITPVEQIGDKKSNERTATDHIFSGGRARGRAPTAVGRERELLCPLPMRVLEARFHPLSKKTGTAVPVARVLCDRERTVVEPIDPQLRRLHPFDPGALMKKLTFLVESAKPRPYEQLTTLRSQFWSFADVSAGDAGGQ